MNIYLSSHHKTGTYFMNDLKKILVKYDTQNIYINDPWSHKANKINININDPNVKIIHFIRHPYEIIMSGFFYHKKCNEEWCVNIKKNTGADNINYNFMGLSYQQKINTLNTEDGINFEMEGRSYNTILDMYNSKFDDYNFCLKIKMEELIENFDETIEKIITFISSDKLTNVDFSSLNINNTNNKEHITNVKLITDRYKDFFTDKNYSHFNELFSKLDLKKYDYVFL
jgi:hypothetical protein